MIRLENVHKVFRKKDKEIVALRGIDLHVASGDIFGIIGYSGSGKSTLVRTMNMLERPTQGAVFVNGANIATLGDQKLGPYRRKMGMIFQQFNLLSSATVFNNIAFPLQLKGVDSADIAKRVEELLALVDLVDKRNEYPANLSGGQKQRVAIARALATAPEILLCDEATSALDPQTTRAILSLLKRINRDLGITVVLITHEMAVVKAICNRVAVISEGLIVEQNTVEEIFGNPQSPVTKELLNPNLLIEE